MGDIFYSLHRILSNFDPIIRDFLREPYSVRSGSFVEIKVIKLRFSP